MKKEEISKLIPKDRLVEFATNFLQEFLKDGFGAATKRSTELHIFYLLEKYGNLDSFDNNALSHLFQITESRLNSYRYESKLRFPPVEDKFIENRILLSLARSEFDGDAKRIKFIVEDPYIRKSLSAISKRLGGVPDTSFNSEVVSLRTDQLLTLVSNLYGKEIANDFKKDFDELNKEYSKIKFEEVRKKLVLGAAGAVGGGLVKVAKAWLAGDPT